MYWLVAILCFATNPPQCPTPPVVFFPTYEACSQAKDAYEKDHPDYKGALECREVHGI